MGKVNGIIEGTQKYTNILSLFGSGKVISCEYFDNLKKEGWKEGA
jgi:hypothetical protein